VDQSLNKITVQCLIDSTKFKLNGLIRRIYTLIFSMLEAIEVYIKEGDPSVIEQVDKMEDEADRVYWLTVRQLLLSQKSWRPPEPEELEARQGGGCGASIPHSG